MAQGLVVKLEEGMTLDCICPWRGNLTMVSWKRELRTFAAYHPIHGMNISSGYTGRVKFLKSSPLDGSISLSNVTERDVGQYQCSIQSFPLGSWTNSVLVKKAGTSQNVHFDCSLKLHFYNLHYFSGQPTTVSFVLQWSLMKAKLTQASELREVVMSRLAATI